MKKSNLLRAGAVVVSLSFVVTACGGSDDEASDTTAPVKCDSPVASIALQFPETGDAANLGAPMLKGATLAINEFNAANPDDCVTLKTFDTLSKPKLNLLFNASLKINSESSLPDCLSSL